MLCHGTMHKNLLRQGLTGIFRSKWGGSGLWLPKKSVHSGSLLVRENWPECLCLKTGLQLRRSSSHRDWRAVPRVVTSNAGTNRKPPWRGLASQAGGLASSADQEAENGGGIHLIVGPMFAGKSTALLRRVQEEATRGRRVALVKSDKDVRYGLSAVVTHDGLEMPCFAVPDLATFRSTLGDKSYSELEVIGIDEAQFFPDLYDFCQTAADFHGKTVIVAGLDGDFLRRKFGSTLDLIPVADTIVKLSSRCEICGRPAIFSFRKTADTNTELVGGADVYMPVCRQHFVNGQMAVEAASNVISAHQMVQVSREL